MSKNSIPRTVPALIAKAVIALDGARILGAELSLAHASADVLAADLFALAGRPEDPSAPEPAAIPGAQNEYAAARAAHAAARKNARVAQRAAREFCGRAIDVLKGRLGRQWNARWHAAGFTEGSIALAPDPLPMLLRFAAHFRHVPGNENESSGITAATTEAEIAALTAARAAVANARMAEAAAKQKRDAAFKRLRKRMSALREELGFTLSNDDPRWYQFGFRRPADGEVPGEVTELTVEAGAPGTVLARWQRAPLADNYRVQWKRANTEDPPTDAGLANDPQFLLRHLPPGEAITVFISARNASGETRPAAATITLPADAAPTPADDAPDSPAGDHSPSSTFQ